MKRKLICFDVNGVLTPTHSIVDLGEYVGKKKEIEKYILGHTTGKTSLSVALMESAWLLNGLSLVKVKEYSWSVVLTNGIYEMTEELIKRGYILAMITTGFTNVMEIMNERLNNAFKYIYANDLIFNSENKLIGNNVKFNVLENESKALHLKRIAEREMIDLEDTVAVGDSAGDKDMLQIAGTAIAFHPNKELEEFAKEMQGWGRNMHIIKELDLTKILPHI